MFNRRRFKPVSRKMISLGLAAIMLMSVPGQSIPTYAMTNQGSQDQDAQEQSVESESGYRLYADELTSASGAVKGDMTEVLPGYEIINVKLPDGSLANPEEVNFPVTESGDYVFEVIYNSASNDADLAKTAEAQTAAIQSEDTQSAEAQSAETQSAEEQNPEQGVEEQSASDALTESAEDTESEELTLTVTLPEEEAAEEPGTEEAEETASEEIQSVSDETQSLDSSLATIPKVSTMSENSGISTYNSDTTWDPQFDYMGSKLEWTRDRFDVNTTYYLSRQGMNFNSNTVLGDAFNIRVQNPDSNFALTSQEIPTFVYGYQQQLDGNRAWIQYSHGFSDINIDLSTDFAMTGTLNVGSDFGRRDETAAGAGAQQFGTSSTPYGVNIDGGVTISLIPTTDITSVVNDAENGLGGGPRLGAYGVFKNSIVMEYDSGFTIGYKTINGDRSSFSIFGSYGTASEELARVGDVTIASRSLNYGGINLPTAKFADYADGKSNGYANTYKAGSVPHMGISLTGDNGFALTNSERRLLIGSNWENESDETGEFTYTIEYHSSNRTLEFTLIKNGIATKSTLQLPESYAGKTYRLATSFGAVYQHSDYYNNGRFFNNSLTADNTLNNGLGTGQIMLDVQGVYTQPDLGNVTNTVAFLNDHDGSISNGVTAYANGYIATGDDEKQQAEKRKTFPLEGDTITVQAETNISSLFNGQGYTDDSGQIVLNELSFTDLQFTDENGTVITDGNGIPPGLDIENINEIEVEYYYSVNSGTTWVPCNQSNTNLSNATIDQSTGDTPLRWRAVITLPETSDITDSANTQFWLTGDVVISVTRSGTDASFRLPLYKDNGERLTFFSDPKDVGTNDLSRNTARIIDTASGIQTLEADLDGDEEAAVSYGVSVWYNSTRRSEEYKPGYTDQNQTYVYKSIDQISDSSNATQGTADTNISLSDDTRYIVTYSMYDSQFNENSNIPTMAENPDRARATTQRVIWKSDNVEVQNGYEFYAEQDVEMSVDDFEGFADSNNKAEYYKKIAEAAGAKIFKTSNYDFVDLTGGEYQVSVNGSAGFSGNGTTESHNKIVAAIENQGTPQEITIRYNVGDGTTVDRTINLTLVESTKRITLDETGTMQTTAAEQVDIYQEDDGTYRITATFYMEGSVLDDSTATYAVYAQEEREESTDPGQWLWGLTERGTIDLSNLTSQRENEAVTGANNIYYGRFYGSTLDVSTETTETGNTKITLTFSNISSPGPTGIDYRIYLWNSANGDKTNREEDIPYQFDSTTALDGSFTNDYARNWQELHVIPQVTTEYDPLTIEETNEAELFYEETTFTVTGTFELEGSAKENFAYLNDHNLLKVALYKQNPTGKTSAGQYVIWATNEGAVKNQSGKVSEPEITRVDDYTFTVSFTITNLVSGGTDSITNQWDDGAKYRIFAWTDNNDLTALNNEDFGSPTDRFQSDASITTVPSTTTTMTGVLGSQVESIIKYPKQISMMDNVRDNDHIYSADQQITLWKLDGVERPDTDMGVDVVIEDIEDTGNRSFNITRGTESIAIKPMLGVTAGGGSDVSLSGLMGTLYFDNSNSSPNTPDDILEFYFRSVEEPHVNDGGEFVGQITFLFRRGSGNLATNGTTVTN